MKRSVIVDTTKKEMNSWNCISFS